MQNDANESGSSHCSSRFARAVVTVEDHPYDRGYWDRILGLGNRVADESWENKERYDEGREDATEELRYERSIDRFDDH